MVMTDPIADMLTRLRNANTSKKDVITLPASNLKRHIAEILSSEGYIGEVSIAGEGKDRTITIRMKYGRDRQRTITGIRRVSKPGKRVYAGRDESSSYEVLERPFELTVGAHAHALPAVDCPINFRMGRLCS